MSKLATLLATARIHPADQVDFAAWQGRHSAMVSKFSGFVSSDMVVPSKGNPDLPWTVILNFDSEESLLEWKRSEERAVLLHEVIPLLDGGTFQETLRTEAEGTLPDAEVTEVIFSKVKSGMGDHYREWAARIQVAQAKCPGYRGMYLQPPAGGSDGYWTSILRYDSTEHLEAWMKSLERKLLIAETKEFIESEDLMRLATSFPGWVPVDPMTGKGPSNWKTAMLVLLGLFPIVMLEMKFLNPVLSALGIHASLAIFIGNVISVSITSFFTMPGFVRSFGWWLLPHTNSASITARGVKILITLFALEVVFLWKLLP